MALTYTFSPKCRLVEYAVDETVHPGE